MGFSTAIHPWESAHTMLGSVGYVDPHYVRSGVVTKKTQRVGEPTRLML
jgi:hypothetical protein